MATNEESMIIRAELALDVQKAQADIARIKKDLANAINQRNVQQRVTGQSSSFVNQHIADLRKQLNDAQKAASVANRELVNFGREGTKAISEADVAVGKLAKGMAGLFTLNKAKEFVSHIVRTRGEFQQLEVAFETILGNKEKADKMMADAVELAAKTPFDLQGVASGAKSLLAFGMNADDVIETLRRLGDVAAGLSLPLSRLTTIYGQTMVKGTLQTRDLLRYQQAGIPILEELAKMYNKTTNEVRAMVTAGKVGFVDVEKVFKKMTDEGGKFANLMEKQSKTITGQISNIQDAIDEMFNELGKKTEGPINSVLNVTSNLVENYEKVGKVLAALAVTYGVAKTASLAYAAALKLGITSIGAHTVAQRANIAVTEMATVSTKTLNKAILSNPYVLVASAITAATVGIIAYARANDVALQAKKKLNDIEEQFVSDMVKEKENYAKLNAELENTEKGSERWNAAKNKAVSMYGKYKSNLEDEIEKTGSLKSSYDELAKSIERASKQRLYNEVGTSVNEEFDAQIEEKQKKLWKRLKSDSSSVDEAAKAYYDMSNYALIAKSGTTIPDNIQQYYLKYGASTYDIMKEIIALRWDKESFNRSLDEWAGEGGVQSQLIQAMSALADASIDSLLEDLATSKKEAEEKAADSIRGAKGKEFEVGNSKYYYATEGEESLNNNISEAIAKMVGDTATLDEKYKKLSEEEKKFNKTYGENKEELDKAAEEYNTTLNEYVARYGEFLDGAEAPLMSLINDARNNYKKYGFTGVSGKLTDMITDRMQKAKPEIYLYKVGNDGQGTRADSDADMIAQTAEEQKKTNAENAKKRQDAAREQAEADAREARASAKKVTDAKKAASEAKISIENEIRQNEINQQNEGFDRQMRQMKLNYDKEIQQIEKQKEDYINKLKAIEKAKFLQANPDKKDADWNENAFYQSATWKENADFVTATYGDNGTLREQAKASYQKSLDDILDSFRGEYGSFADKQLKIKMDADKKMQSLYLASLQADTDEEKALISQGIKSIIVARDEALAQSEYEYAQKYQDMEAQRSAYIKMQKAAYAKYLTENPEASQTDKDYFKNKQAYELASYEYDQVKDYGQIDDVMAALRKKWDAFLTTLPEDMREKATKVMKDEMLSTYQSGSEEFETFVNRLGTFSLSELQQRLQQTQGLLDTAKETSNGAESEQITDLEMRIEALKKRIKELQGQTDSGKMSWQELNSVLSSSISIFDEVGNIVGDTGKLIISVSSSIATSTLSMVNAIKTLKDGAKGIEAATSILAIVSAVIKVFTTIINASQSAREQMDKTAAATANYRHQLELLKLSFSQADFENAFGTDKIGLLQKAWTSAGNSLALYNKQLKVVGEKVAYYAKGAAQFDPTGVLPYYRTIEDYQKKLMTDGQYDYEKIINMYNAYTSMANPTEEMQEQIKYLEELKTKWEEAKNVVSSFIHELTGDVTANLADQMLENFINTGSAIVDMSDYMEQFQKSTAKAIIQSKLLGQVFTDEAQDEIASMLANGNVTGAIDKYNSLLEQANALAPDIEEYLKGIGADKWTSSDRSAASTGFAAMSQDSANELNGRFTAVQNNTYELNETTKAIKDQNTQMLSISGQILLEVQGIHSDTTDINGKVSGLEENVKGMKKSIDYIMTEGVKVSMS